MVYTEETVVDESSLEQLIANVQVSDAILVYNLMLQRKISISNELRQSFLELICFNNHEDNIPEELIEERWFSRNNIGKERQRKTWKDGGLAESIFNEIEPKDSATYAAIIRGMCKYIQAERGYAFYQEALQKDLHIDVATFNSVIRIVNFLREGAEMRWLLVQELLQTMAIRKVKPNLETMNSVLTIVASIGIMKAREYALQTIAEFKALGIEPSLESWYHVLSIFCRVQISHVLCDILNEIEGKEFKIQGLKDTFFFVTAMNICRNHLNDKNLAKRVNDLLHFGNNYELLGDAYRESIYHAHYFVVLCNNEPLDVFMETYNILVPNVYTPDAAVMIEILKQVNVNGALELIPRLWSDIVLFEQMNREEILELTLNIMGENIPNKDIPAHSNLNEQFSDIAWQIFNKLEEDRTEMRTRNPLSFTSKMISNILTLTCRSEDYEKALKVFEKMDQNQDEIIGVTDAAALELFIKLCISKKQPSKAIAALQYCVENSFSNNQALGRLIVDSLTLDGYHISKITSLIGTDVLKSTE